MPNPVNPYITGNPVGGNPQSGRSNYLDFELGIGPGRGREYPVAVLHSPAGTARATMRFPFEELALENRIQDLQNVLLRSGGRRRAAPSDEEEGAVQDFGQTLFDALLSGEAWGATWMTETQGGSDLGATTTAARRAGDR